MKIYFSDILFFASQLIFKIMINIDGKVMERQYT